MCNLYHVSPKGQIVTHFRLKVVPEWLEAVMVGPFGTGAFLREGPQGLEAVQGQWGMIAPRARTRRPESRAILTNNARVESVAERPTYRDAWRAGRRCLIPASWYQEPNWETGKNLWWRLRRADGEPWALAGLWNEWTDPVSGEIVPNYTLLTCNCDGHPLLGRLHKPDPKLPPDAQDKRAVAHIAPTDWAQWLHGSTEEALALIRPQPAEVFDPDDALKTDQWLAERASPPAQRSIW